MRQSRTFPWRSAPRDATGVRDGESSRTRKVVAVGAATVLAMAAVAFWVVASMPPVLASVQPGQADMPPQTPLTLSIWNLGGGVRQLTMTESFYDIDGNLGPAREVPVQLVPTGTNSATPWRTDYVVQRTDSSPLMAYDGQYHLDIVAASTASSLVGKPTVSQRYEFTTQPSPKLRLPAAPVQLNYQAPVELAWNRPIDSFRVDTVPPVDVRTWIDPANAERSYVELANPKPDTQYEIRVLDASAVGGGKLVAPITEKVVTPAPPAILGDKVKLEEGYRISIPWDRPIKSLDYEITPPVQSVSQIGGLDPKQSSILLQDPKQGQEYTVRVKGAIASTGFPLPTPLDLKVTTPKPLKIDKFDPAEQPKFGVPLGAGINISFSEPVKDRAAAEAAIQITPAIKGKFVWKAPNAVQFAPDSNMPGATDFTVSIAGGRAGAIGQDGGYLDKTEQFAFWTAPEKEIEVNLSAQTLTLWEGGHPVWDTLVSTGVTGAETPTGLFQVQYKLLKTRMVGTNPSGHHYDLPDVPWVLPFLGDYTLHGAYWRDNYGYPQSNGCVSMPVPVAQKVYYWADVGTPIRIHY